MIANESVILLHGLCRTNASMAKMASALSIAGFVVENINYPSRTESIANLSDNAIAPALKVLQSCAKIHFVTHSMGGILVRSYFSRHKSDQLGRVVMLGPPNQGTELVDRLGKLWLFQRINGPAGNELSTSPESTPNQLGPVGFELGVIAGDRSINWINSLIIPGKDDGKVSIDRTKVSGMKEHLIIHATHPYLMKNTVAIQATLQFLQTGSFRHKN
jgi:triacylglycerol lipase